MYSNQYPYQYNPYFNEYYRLNNDRQNLNDIQKAINGEYSAIACYEKLAKMAPTKNERDQILEIQKDERRHLEEFNRIYTILTGKQPAYKMSEECPNKYQAGIEFAFRDEQETVDFYLDLAEKSEDPLIKEVLRRAAADEQNHAVWFLFFMMKNQR